MGIFLFGEGNSYGEQRICTIDVGDRSLGHEATPTRLRGRDYLAFFQVSRSNWPITPACETWQSQLHDELEKSQ